MCVWSKAEWERHPERHGTVIALSEHKAEGCGAEGCGKRVVGLRTVRLVRLRHVG